MYESYINDLENLEKKYIKRNLVPIKKQGKFVFVEGGKKMLNLSSNDYLGFAENKKIIENFFKYIKDDLIPFGCGSSRLLTGNNIQYNELESYLKSLYKKESALVFNSGYCGNLGIYSSFASCKFDAIFMDKLNHASIYDGIKMGSAAKVFRYKHLDYDHLENLLIKHRNSYKNAIIVTESVFSMDGDVCNLRKLVELKKKYDTMIFVDEAHAFGIFGDTGLGICESEDVIEDIDLIFGTFGKAIGSQGAFCVGAKVLIDYLINRSRSFIFTTGMSPINVKYTYYMLKEVMPKTKTLRKELLDNLTKRIREYFEKKGLNIVGSTNIIPVIIGTNIKTIQVCDKLQQRGFYCLPIRHPTVAIGTSRIRISLRADLSFEDISEVADIIIEGIKS